MVNVHLLPRLAGGRLVSASKRFGASVKDGASTNNLDVDGTRVDDNGPAISMPESATPTQAGALEDNLSMEAGSESRASAVGDTVSTNLHGNSALAMIDTGKVAAASDVVPPVVSSTGTRGMTLVG